MRKMGMEGERGEVGEAKKERKKERRREVAVTDHITPVAHSPRLVFVNSLNTKENPQY